MTDLSPVAVAFVLRSYNARMTVAPRSITDSPWFWAYLFGTAALIALALAGPKFGARQAQIEREFQGRERAAQNINGQEPNAPLSTTGQTLITLRPLFIGMAILTAGAWCVHWWTWRRSLPASSRVATP